MTDDSQSLIAFIGADLIIWQYIILEVILGVTYLSLGLEYLRSSLGLQSNRDSGYS